MRWVDPLGLIVGRASMVNTMVSDGGSRGNPSNPGTSQGYQEQLQCQSEYGPIQTFMIMGLANATDWFERTINNAFNAILEIGKNVVETEARYAKKTWDSLRNGDWGGYANSLINSVTCGGWDAAINGMNRRYAEYKENPSIYTSLNRLSFGLVETFGRALFPESYGIEANSVEHWEAFYGALLTEVVVLKTVKVTSNSIERVTTNPHSPAGLENTAYLPENMDMSQAAMQQQAFTRQFINSKIPQDRQAAVIDAFEPDMVAVTLTEDISVFRYHGQGSNAVGSWYTPYLYEDPVAMLALPPENSVEFVSRYVIPKGTTVLQGHVAKNFGQPGQGFQIYVAYEDWGAILPQ